MSSSFSNTSPESLATYSSISSIIVFFIANLIVIFPFTITIPILFPAKITKVIQNLNNALSNNFKLILNPNHRRLINSNSTLRTHTNVSNIPPPNAHQIRFKLRLPFTYQTAPILSVLFLLITRATDATVIRQGIVGTNGVQPLDILALFISLAYLSVSLDNTGFFRYLAFSVAKKSGSSGKKLFALLYFFFLISGVIVGNDPVILSGTAFLAYLTRVSGVTPPTAWIFSEFAAANIASAVLPPSNPTNLVVTGAFTLSFLSYAAHTILPSLAAAILSYIFLIIKYRSREYIPQTIDLRELDNSSTNTLIPIASQNRNQNQNQIAANQTSISQSDSLAPTDRLGTTSMLIRGVLVDRTGAILGTILLSITLIVLVGTSPLKVPVWEITAPSALIMFARDIWHDKSRWKVLFRGNFRMDLTSLRDEYDRTEIPQPRPVSYWQQCNHLHRNFFPTASNVLSHLPISLIPFALSMFILVQNLVSKGWINVFASWWAAWVRACAKNGEVSETVGAVILMMILTAVLCNICGTNIGTAILMARVLQIWFQINNPTINPRLKTGCIYAVALGSNLGAISFSFSASLAGLLWRSILRQKGIHISQKQFAYQNSPILLISICAAASVLIAEVFIMSG